MAQCGWANVDVAHESPRSDSHAHQSIGSRRLRGQPIEFACDSCQFDALMVDLAPEHAAYRWEQNQGYAAPEHLDALRETIRATPDGGFEVIDWKTGPVPGAAELAAAGVQLAAYRLGWSRLTGVPVERVSAGFHHVSANRTLRPVDLLDEAGLLALVTGA